MINLKPLSILILSFLIISCSKKESRQACTWYINGQAFSSSNVILYEDRGGSALFVMDGDKTNNVDKNNGFYLGYGVGALPAAGSYPLYNGPASNDPSLLRLHIYRSGTQYILSKYNAASILIFGTKGKRKFELPEAWFTNTGNEQDSALIKGTFWEPR